MAESPPSEAVRLVGVTKRFGRTAAVDGVDLTAEAGQITTLLGPSGCGKTTTLRLVAGFVSADAGDIYVGARRVNDLPPHRRPTRTVFQNYALFPHLSVGANVAFGLEQQGVPGGERARRVAEALERVGLAGYADRQPGQLSGGQQQRVALARALVTRPAVLLLDEPLSNLDARLRVSMRGEIRHLQREAGITTLYVTHDQEEALSLSDRVVVMHEGQVLQVGPPATIYERPATRFVAAFLGLANFLVGRVVALDGAADDGPRAVVEIGDRRAAVAAAVAPSVGSSVEVLVRPEHLRLLPAREADSAGGWSGEAAAGGPGSGAPGWDGTVAGVSYLGSVARYQVAVAGQPLLTVDQHAPRGAALLVVGTPVRLQLRAGSAYLPADSVGGPSNT